MEQDAEMMRLQLLGDPNLMAQLRQVRPDFCFYFLLPIRSDEQLRFTFGSSSNHDTGSRKSGAESQYRILS